MWNKIFLTGIALGFISLSCVERPTNNSLNINSIEENPGATPQLYMKGFISTGLSERDAAISDDGNEFYYTLWTGTFGIILHSKKDNNAWGKPEITSFSSKYSNLEPFISSDGTRLFFVSNRPTDSSDNHQDYNIWYVDRTSEGWSSPVETSTKVNTEANEFYPSLSDNGNLYFTARYDNSIGGEDIWMCELLNGNYKEPINLGGNVNSQKDDFNAFVAPDESYIIFSSWNREDSYGSGDLYISFKDENEEWQPAINLGKNINSASIDYCPSVSRDGTKFFFTSRRLSKELEEQNIRDYSQISDLMTNPRNGQNDIYWMKSNFIDSLRQLK